MLSTWAFGALTLLAMPQSERTIAVVAEDAKGAVVSELSAEDLAVVEDGVARTVTRVKADERPLTLAVVLDSSAVFEMSLRTDMIEPLVTFLAGLPAGSTFAVWTTGDRPIKVVDFTDDAAGAGPPLRKVTPRGGSTTFDAIDEALTALSGREGARSALLIVTGNAVEFSGRERPAALSDADLRGDTRIEAILIDLGRLAAIPNPQEHRSPMERIAEYERTLKGLAESTGGRFERLLSTMGVAQALERVRQSLRGSLLVTYVSDSDAGQPKIEVKVARPGITVRAGAPLGAR